MRFFRSPRLCGEICFSLFALTCTPAPAQVQLNHGAEGVSVRIDGRDFTTLHFGEALHKPYLHPLRTASGKVITRGFPVDPQPGELTGLPHQLGLWVGHEHVNDVDFFEVDPSYRRPRKLGRIAFKDVTQVTSGQDQGVLSFAADWIAPDGTAVLRESRKMTFYARAGRRQFDVEIVLHANEPLTFADEADGILGLRLGAPFEERNGGVVTNFTGEHGADGVIGKRSPWLDYQAEVQGEKVGVAIFDHPANYNFPTRWKVRAWASIFVSPFAERSFYHEKPFSGTVPKTSKDASLSLAAGEDIRFRYRLLIYPPPLDLDAAWREFAQLP